MPSDSGPSGPTTVRSIFCLPGEVQQPRDVGGGDGHALGRLGDPGVAGSAEHLFHLRALGNLPHQSVLSSAAADHEYLHAILPGIESVDL